MISTSRFTSTLKMPDKTFRSDFECRHGALAGKVFHRQVKRASASAERRFSRWEKRPRAEKSLRNVLSGNEDS